MRGKRFLILSLLVALTAYLFDVECLLGGPECCLDEAVCVAPVTHSDHAAPLPIILPPTPEMGGPPNERVAVPIHYRPFVPPQTADVPPQQPSRAPPVS